MDQFFPLEETVLEWRSAGGMGRRYQLLAKRGVIAELGLGKQFRRDTTIATAHGSWRLQGTDRRIEIDGGPVLAARDPTATKWTLSQPSLRLEITNPWGTDWQWIDGEGNGLLGLRQKGFAQLAATAFVDEAMFEVPMTPLLLGLGFCTLLEKAMRAQAA